MYEAFFGLTERPFSITPDPRYLFMSTRHREALAHLLYGIGEQGGFVLLTGEVGTGKTTVTRTLLEQLPKDVDVALILNPRLSALELVASVCDELRIDYPAETASIKVLIDRLNTYLLDAHGRHRHTVLIIDEAQNLSAEVLEQIRLLTNLETASHKLLRIILVGQPELNELLARQELRQLAQRITARYHLDTLSPQDTVAYVRHRLAVAGVEHNPFTPAALKTLQRVSVGTPRLINTICDRALLGAYAHDSHRVTPSMVRQAAREVTGHSRSRRWPVLAVAAMALVAVVLVLGFLFGRQWGLPVSSEPGLVVSATRQADEVANSAEPTVRQRLPSSSEAAAANPSPSASEPQLVDAPVVPTGQSAVSPQTVLAVPSTPQRVGDGPQVEGPVLASTAGEISESPALPALAVTVSAPPADVARHPEPVPVSAGVSADTSVPPPTLAEALGQPPLPDERHRALADLFRLWGLDIQAEYPCEQAVQSGLRCQTGSTSWQRLLHLGLPAILELTAPPQLPRYALLTEVDGRGVHIRLAGQAYSSPAEQLQHYWSGRYILAWRPPRGMGRTLFPGMRGDDVVVLHHNLDSITGTTTPVPPDQRYDERLQQRVRQFQVAHGLTRDAIVGTRTLLHLSVALADEGRPALIRPIPAAP